MTNIFEWRPRRIAIAGVRFQSGGDAGKTPEQIAADKATADAAAAADANKGKTPEQIAADKKTADDAAAAAKAETDKAAGKGGKEGDDSQPKVPDSYELTVPDEAKKAIGDKHVERITKAVEEFAKANKLTAEQAQGELEARLDGAHAAVSGLSNEWLAETTAHATYGGAALEANQALARKAVDGIFPPGHELRDAFIADLNQTGIGNKLTVVAFLATVGKLMGEDAPNLGKNKGKEPEKKSDADVMFPSSAPKPAT